MNLTSEFESFKENLILSKKYWIIYLIFILITCVYAVYNYNVMHPKLVILMFISTSLLGVFCIVYYFMHNCDEELYKVAFVIILTFGLLCCVFTPIVNHVDELEHLTRSEITSQGVIFPDWIGDEKGIDRLYNASSGERSNIYNHGVGFRTIESIKFYSTFREKTVMQTNNDTDKINMTPFIRGSAFEQNPFYGYLPQGIGIFIAKLLDLNVIWILWLGRIFNMIFYASVVSLAVKKSPSLKMPLLVVACIPVAIYHSASVSIDAMIFALGLLAIAYFIYMCQSDVDSLDHKNILVYSIICLLLGLCKLPYLAFIFLLFFVPKTNFKKYNIIHILLCIFVVGIIGVVWSKYSTPALMHSWRSSLNYVNSTQQMNYLINNPPEILTFLIHTVTSGLSYILSELFNFDYWYPESFARYSLITILLQIYLAISLFAYPNDFRFDIKAKVGSLLVFVIIYFGTFFIQLLTWANVGDMLVGVHMRYFIPLLALIPIIVQIKNNPFERKTFDKFAIVFMVGFIATLLMAVVTRFY